MRKLSSKMIEKINTSIQTTANKSDPRMSIKVSRAKTTIMDSDYWTVETIRSKSGLGDVSVAPRRFKPYGSPNRIYDIHVDSGAVGTAIREYPDTFKEGWKDQFIVGEGSSVAVAFDGEWHRYRGLWRLVTSEKPWLFWVSSSGDLWRQHWDDESTCFQLDSGVTQVRAIRAWKNRNTDDLDQGIVVGYVKTDGTVWYRNYCKQTDGSLIWEVARQVTPFSNAQYLNLFITNDYRMGFVAQLANNEIQWILTERNWSGMALDAESLESGISAVEIQITEIEILKNDIEKEVLVSSISTEIQLCPTDVNFEILESSVIPPQRVKVRFPFKVTFDSRTREFLSIKNLNTVVPVTSIEHGESEEEIILTTSNLNPYVETYVTLADQSSLRLNVTEVCRPVLPGITHTVRPLPPPPGYLSETIAPFIPAINVSLKYIDRQSYQAIEETLVPGIGSVSIVLTKVGTAPI